MEKDAEHDVGPASGVGARPSAARLSTGIVVLSVSSLASAAIEPNAQFGATLYVTPAQTQTVPETAASAPGRGFIVIDDDESVFSYHEAQLEKRMLLADRNVGDCSSCGSGGSSGGSGGAEPDPCQGMPPSQCILQAPPDALEAAGNIVMDAFANGLKSCFVATALFGAESHQVRVLQRFRDLTLREYAWGEKFVRWYYRHGPGLAKFVVRFPLLRSLLRIVLSLFVGMLAYYYRRALPQDHQASAVA